MVKIKTIEITTMRYVRGSLEAFLDGKKELNWVKGTIKNSGILNYKGMLQEIFDGLRRYSKLTRYQSILKVCQKEGWLKS
ncbi:hypothetical protein A3C26_01240 [Candidatus Daviesbacteria bacterium RIFCSPHIGHO2_02_FULL_39_12]|uniref:Uncharacterized protein n=2 Tax=Candidatus Daviesiibacteriota TaxID=1752718 RepID=A0A1F5JBQ9_9BACT|nr:MAG: hypothetical protein A3C26_01240 [Candidatus Daviesbacteria bacterium RIFCSPHIGHO2_02_FULL_39_12]OGE72722.1 MAG: hypothetical protein A3H40_03155 [Candidatus Daviesbacteria bacterium RIFCSPLOWO2_02_FULL_38_15]